MRPFLTLLVTFGGTTLNMTRSDFEEEGFILVHCLRAKFTVAEVQRADTVCAELGLSWSFSSILFSLGSPPWDGDTTSRLGLSGLS